VAHERLRRVCFVDYDREMVFVAEQAATQGSARVSLGGGALVPSARHAECPVDHVGGRSLSTSGVGTEFLKNMVTIARAEGIKKIWAEIRQENKEMLHISERLGFRHTSCTDGTVRVHLEL
jgi:acetyltransferase